MSRRPPSRRDRPSGPPWLIRAIVVVAVAVVVLALVLTVATGTLFMTPSGR